MERMKRNTTVLQELSALVAAALPVLQLFAFYLPPQLVNIYLLQEKFVGVSVIALLLSYILIIAYRSKPYFYVTFPFQGNKVAEYQEYMRQINEVGALRRVLAGDKKIDEVADKLLEDIQKTPKSPPLQLKHDNLLDLCIVLLLTTSITFVILGLAGSSLVSGVVQSVSYIFIIVSAVLALTVYRFNTSNSKRYEEDQRERINRAVEIATKMNCFGLQPQVQFTSCFDDGNFPSQFHVFVDYEGDKYEITTDMSGQLLKSCYKIT